jgi:hypothetical protein
VQVEGRTTFPVINDFSTVEFGEKFNEFLALQENPVTTQPNEKGTKSSPISKPVAAAAEISGDTIFSISETDDAIMEKEQVSLLPNPLSDPHDPLLCDSDGVASVTITLFGDVPKSLVPAKHRSFTTTRPSLLPYQFTAVTSNDDNTLFVGKFESSFDFTVVCTFNFDPGGDKFSLVTDSGGSRRIFSLLWLPWDRGKKSGNWMSIVQVPTTSPCLFSGIWYFGNLGYANITCTAPHMKEEEAVMGN